MVLCSAPGGCVLVDITTMMVTSPPGAEFFSDYRIADHNAASRCCCQQRQYDQSDHVHFFWPFFFEFKWRSVA